PDGVHQYTVAAVLETDIEQVPFNRTVFAGDADFLSFTQSLRSASLVDTDVPITADSRLLILVTCSYSWEDARYVIVAVS
ncbi:MAG: class B sortase, partial [Subdoligranulum sp.]|nr:class B sortase [Subdoligranulum sp.]